MTIIHVAAGIIWHADNTQILIARRPEHLHQGGLWEFPGGKLESSETAEAALSRELYEELHIRFQHAEHFQRIQHDYGDKTVCLDFYHVRGINADIQAQEGQEWRWVNITELMHYTFPAANKAIVDALIQRYSENCSPK